MRIKKTFKVLAFLILAANLRTAPAVADELTQPLTADEVACNERQLEKMLLRMKAVQAGFAHSPVPTLLLVSYSNSSGFYDGLVATGQSYQLDLPQTPPVDSYERQLAFNLNPSVRSLRLNPARPELPQITLSREESNSNLVPPDSFFNVVVTLEPTLGAGDPLMINNFLVPAPGSAYNGFLASSTKPGRGLKQDGLLEPCHEKLTDFDLHVFSILQRMVRGGDLSAGLREPDSEFAIFRGEDPHTFRINFYPVLEHFTTGGRLAVELKVSWTDAGELTSAVMTALPACTREGELGCTIVGYVEPTGYVTPSIYLIPPVFGGTEYYPNESARNGVFYSWNRGPSPPSTIDFGALLAHTTWNRAVW